MAVASHAGGICRCKPSTPKNADGILPTLIVLDEAARIEDATYDRALSALSKVPGSQALIVTTPDKDQRRRSYGTTVGILERAYDDGEAAPAGIVGMIFGIDSTDDAEDEECWYKAQPGLGITKSIADYRFQKTMLLDPGTPNGRDEFWTQQLATFTDDLAGALPLSLYDACVEDWNLEDYRGLPAVIGVDFSHEVLAWGREHVLAPEPQHVRDRVTLVLANVLDVVAPKVDVVGAFNFSYLIFKQRAQLIAYFKSAYESLNRDGLFYCDLFGGTDAIVPIVEPRRCRTGFTYVWEHESYNPITNEILCHIHFKFRDGSEWKKAFTYDWRLWTIPEVRECLLEAGFKDTQVWWDPVDETDYRLTEKEGNQLGWLVYIVGVK